MKKKILYFLITGSFLLGSLTGCSASSNSANTTNNNAEGTASSEHADENYYYGTLNVSYANYYYGELNYIEAEDPETSVKGQYDVADPVEMAGYNEEGIYDAVTSATTQKSTAFESAFTEETSDGGINILGPSNVNVAISKELYEDVQNAIKEGTECKNQLIELVQSLGEVSETKPAEYKVINSDGTLSRTIGETAEATGVTATIQTTSVWGNYEIFLDGLDVDANTVQGVIFETEDGSKYGLEHEDNIWLQANDIAFAVEAFIEPHQNEVAYQRFADLPGKTITKITYLISNADDIEINTSLLVKLQLEDSYSITAEERVPYNAEGSAVQINRTVPEDSSYALESVVHGEEILDTGSYTYTEGTLTLNSACKPGQYKFTFVDDKYVDLVTYVIVDSGLAADDVNFKDNKLVVNESAGNWTLADYLAAITSVSINENPLRGNSLGTTIFNPDGSIHFEATITSRGTENAVFEGSNSYELTIDALGYPSVAFTVTP